MAPYLLSLGSLIVGLIGGYIADYFRGGIAEKRQRKFAREEFQRQTLLELQDAASKLATATRLLHLEDVKWYEKTGKWPSGDNVLPGLEDYHQAHDDVNRLRSRVRDWDLMVEVQEFMNICHGATMPLPPSPLFQDEQMKETTTKALDKMHDQHLLLNDHLGEAMSDML